MSGAVAILIIERDAFEFEGCFPVRRRLPLDWARRLGNGVHSKPDGRFSAETEVPVRLGEMLGKRN